MQSKYIEAAAYALEAVMKAGADKASCRAGGGRKDEFNVEANKFTLLRTLFSDDLSIKVIKDHRKGVAMINKLDRDSIKQAVDDCMKLAASAEPDEAEDIAEKQENDSFIRGVGGSDMDALFNRSKEFLNQLKDEFPQIVLEGMTSEFNANASAYVNSNGAAFDTETEYYQVGSMFSAKDGEKSSSFNGFAANLTAIDRPFIDIGMHRALLAESVKSLNARMADEKFVGKIIVTPACDDMIWRTIVECFLSDYALIQGTSRWKDALGTVVADKQLTFRAAPLHPEIVAGERYTADGFLSRDADIIKDGALKSFALSLYGANKTGKPRAANTAFYSNIEVLPGDVPLADLIKGVDRGVLVNRFSGASPGPGGDVSGVAKNSFLIENGEVTDALQETMISFNILEILMNIAGISRERGANGFNVLPWCCFDGVTISGNN